MYSFEIEALSLCSLVLLAIVAPSSSVVAGDESAVEQESNKDDSDTVRERVLRSFSAEVEAEVEAADRFALLNHFFAVRMVLRHLESSSH